MSVIVAEKITAAPAGEFAPMVPREIREALRDNSPALALWTEAMSKPEGWLMGSRDRIAELMCWPVYRVRKAIRGLVDAGLYLVDRIQDAAGRFSTVCRFVASLASSQVTPKADIPKAGKPARTPPSRRIKREGRIGGGSLHSPQTCKREAAGLPCRQCAAVAAAAKLVEKPSTATLPASRPAADVLRDEHDECEHGATPHRCAFCRRAAHA